VREGRGVGGRVGGVTDDTVGVSPGVAEAVAEAGSVEVEGGVITGKA
jgi:hypothetical protein